MDGTAVTPSHYETVMQGRKCQSEVLVWFFFRGEGNATSLPLAVKTKLPEFQMVKKKIAVALSGLQVANANMYLTSLGLGKKCGSVILDRKDGQLRFRRRNRAFKTSFVLSCKCNLAEIAH